MTNPWFDLLNHPNDIRTIVLPDIPNTAKELDRYSDDGILFCHPRCQFIKRLEERRVVANSYPGRFDEHPAQVSVPSMSQPSGIIGFPGGMG